jgi:hypothetical protein
LTEPLDLSKVGAEPPAPAPGGPRRRPPGRARRRVLPALALVAAAAAAFVVLGPFGGEGDGGEGAAVDEVSGYCEAAAEVDRVAQETGAATAPGVYDGPPEAIDALVAQADGSLDDLRSTAPEAARDDVATVVDGLRAAAAGNAEAVRDAAFTAAATRATRQRLTECGSSAGTNGGD